MKQFDNPIDYDEYVERRIIAEHTGNYFVEECEVNGVNKK